MKSKTVLGADGTTKMREITVGIHGKGGEVGIRAVQQLAGMVSSLKQCKTPQEVYDRYLQITGYCKCCIDCGFMDKKGADSVKEWAKSFYLSAAWENTRAAYLMSQPEDIKKERERFTEDNLSADNDSGMIIYDNKFSELKQVESKPYTPNALQMQNIQENVCTHFGTNMDILQW